ncbi:CAP domain-containing protein [Candidatus Saccharibacteria bacterium]|nr:CAP domain-containing protein [Candidatus Saccharibacteria bacterium]MCL1962698.1 CAP domain-containing protein [Candidatus Saccharibacteria bacterium]
MATKKPKKTKKAPQSAPRQPKKSFWHISKLIFIPHRHNNYHPHFIRHYGLIILAIFVILVNVGYSVLHNNQILGDQMLITDAQLLASTNNQREQGGLKPLQLNSELARAAEEKAKDMLNKGYWSHDAPDGTTPWHWIESSGYKYSYAGENLARGFTTVDGIMRAWLDSPSHRENVLNANYTEVGFAAIPGEMSGKKTTLVVAMYGQPKRVGTVAGTTTHEGKLEQDTWTTHLKRGVQSLTPSLIFVLIVLGIAASIAVLTHYMHWKLSPKWARTLRLHHTLVKICFIAFLAIGSILSYGGGMI